MFEYLHGRCIAEPLGKKVLYLKPRKKQSYIDDKLRRFRQNKEAIFCCINALCIANEADQKKVLNWLNEKIDQNL
jgi:hypothetical protein